MSNRARHVKPDVRHILGTSEVTIDIPYAAIEEHVSSIKPATGSVPTCSTKDPGEIRLIERHLQVSPDVVTSGEKTACEGGWQKQNKSRSREQQCGKLHLFS